MIMKYALCLLLVVSSCCARAVEDESVVSVYTTQPGPAAGAGAGTAQPQFDVYRLIANNIAERITSPIYRFLGLRRNKTDDSLTHSWEKVELFDGPEDVTKSNRPVDNDISIDSRDVEELSVEALKKIDKKPEKITLFSGYLPVNEITERNNTINEIADDDDDSFSFGLDDVDPPTTSTSRESGPLVYVLETFGSIIQFFVGAIGAIFNMSAGNNNNDTSDNNSS